MIPKSVYPPAEDSYLMQDILKKEVPNLLEQNPELKFLEIGPGSGIHLETVRKLGIKKENIFSVDINPDAVAHCSSLGFNCKQSNLFENVEDKFDIIIFNPPYLPEDEREDCASKTATTGGIKGCEIINRFLRESKNYLTKEGKAYLITSSLSGNVEWDNWNKKILGSEKLFFEELYVWELSR